MRGAEREETPVDRPAPIRRVLITADAVGGVWPYTLHLASALRQRGLEITIVTSARTDEEGRQLLDMLGMPFRKEG